MDKELRTKRQTMVKGLGTKRQTMVKGLRTKRQTMVKGLRTKRQNACTSGVKTVSPSIAPEIIHFVLV
jgi:hypothetical protein